MIAKQSTALTVVVGPILDSTGAEYASAVIGDLSISKNGGTLTAMASAATLTYIANGMYTLVTTTANMDTLGAVQITCNKATYQMPKLERNVVPASVYDAIITNATNSTGGLPTATAAISAFAGAISTLTAGGVRTELATELSRIDQAIGSRATQVSVDTLAGYVDTEVAAIKAKTDNLPSDPADASDIATSFGMVNSTLSTIASYIDTEVSAIKAKTDLIAAFPANFANLGIDPSGSILIVETVAELGASALTANGAGDAIPVYVWDEILNGATHNIPSSAGRRLRQIASSIVYGGTAQGPGTGNNQIQLDTGASATNGAYDPSIIAIEAGTGAGQTRLILQYVGSTRTATVDRDWRINPDNTSEFVILGDAGRESVNEGLAQGGTATSITLNASASSTDDAYNGQLVFIRSGTGQDQVALVEDYVGSTKVATIRTRAANGQWATIPNTTSAYVMIPNLTFTVAEIAAEVGTLQVLARLNSMIESDGNGQFRFDTIAMSLAAGGAGGAVNITVEDRSITVT